MGEATGTTFYRIHTDGACSGNPGPGGWAVIVEKLCGREYRHVATFGGNELVATNNAMELKAVLVAVQIAIRTAVKNVESGPASFEVVSDSAYVIGAINNRWLDKWAKNGWKTKAGSDVKNVWLWRPMHRLLSVRGTGLVSIKFSRCKGHSGDTMNEMADKEAVRQRKLIEG